VLDNLLEKNLHYGLYRGICQDNQDPSSHNLIKVTIPDIYGDTYVTDWIPGCMPVVDNANHPDHVAHTAAKVAELLNAHADHIVTGTTGSGGNPSHSHSFSATVSHTNNHTGNSKILTHAHQTSTDPLDTITDSPEHTYHRTVPNIGQVVWIMFEKGDPNFPVWMGVYL